MMRKRNRILGALTAVLVLALGLSAGALLHHRQASASSGGEIPYDFTFTSAATFAGWGYTEDQTHIDHAARRMSLKAGVATFGRQSLGSYHTKFDLKLTGSGWYALTLRRQGELTVTNQIEAIYTTEKSGYYLFTQGQNLELMRGEYPNNDIYATAACPDGSFLDGTSRTFDVTVSNEGDDSVTFLVKVDGRELIRFNTRDIPGDAKYPEPLPDGYLMIHSSGVASEYAGYDSRADGRIDLTDRSFYDSWATRDGLSHQPISFADGSYTVGAFGSRQNDKGETIQTGWPSANQTTLLGSRKVGGYSAAFEAAWTPVAGSSPVSFHLGLLMEDDPAADAWTDATNISLLTTPHNAYALEITSNRVDLLRIAPDGTTSILRYNPLGTTENPVNLFDGAAHSFYIGVRESQDKTDQIFTLVVDGKVIFSHALSRGVDYGNDPLEEKFLGTINRGCLQIATRGLTGNLTNLADDRSAFMEEFFTTDYGTDNGVTNENGVITMPRGDHADPGSGSGWLYQTLSAVHSTRSVGTDYAMSFRLNASSIAGKQGWMKIALNAEEDRYSTATGTISNYMLYLAPDGSVQLLRDAQPMTGGYRAGANLIDGREHGITILRETSGEGTRIRVFADEEKLLDATDGTSAAQRGGYVYFVQNEVETGIVKGVSVYELSTASSLELTGDFRTLYKTGDELDLTDMNLRLRYSDGTFTVLPVTGDMISGFSTETAGEGLKATVSYAGMSLEWVYTVEQGEVLLYFKEGIAYKTEYSVGDALDTSGIVICARQEDGRYLDVNVTPDMVTGFDSSRGTTGQVLTVTYGGNTLTYTVNINKRITGISVKSGYPSVCGVGETFDYDNMKLSLTYDDGTTGEIGITGDMLDLRAAAKGETLVNLTYAGLRTSFTVTGTEDAWDAGGDGALRARLPEINIADPEDMDLNTASVIRDYNAFQFGATAGGYREIPAVGTPPSYRVSFDMSIPAGILDGSVRMGLRFNTENTVNEGDLYGYYLLVYNGNIRIHKSHPGDQAQYGYLMAAAAFDTRNLGTSAIYDGRSHRYSIEIFDRGEDTVVINVMIDNVHILRLEDDGTQAEQAWSLGPIAEADRRPYVTPGRFSLFFSGSEMLTFVGSPNENTVSPDFFAGNNSLWNLTGGSDAILTPGRIEFVGSESAVASKDKVRNLSMVFGLTPKELSGEDWIYAMGLRLQTNDPISNLFTQSETEGYGLYFYADRVELRTGGRTVKVLSGLNLEAGRESVVTVTMVNAGEQIVLSVSVDGRGMNYLSSALSGIAAAGYLQMTAGRGGAFLDAAEEEVRNFRVLFIGNSITSCAPIPSEGWNLGGQDWGMAVDDKSKDYVHLVMEKIRAIPGYENAEYRIAQAAAFERAYASYDYITEFSAQREFAADLIIGRIAENADSNDAAYVISNPFSLYYGRLIDYLNPKGSSVILTTSYWGTGENLKDSLIDEQIVKLARERNYPLVRLGDLGSAFASENDASADEAYYAAKEGTLPGGRTWKEEFDGWSSGVRRHPGINGMRNIAARIFESVQNLLTGGDPYIQKFTELEWGGTLEYTDSSLYGGADGSYPGTEFQSFEMRELADGSPEFGQVTEKEAGNYVLYRLFDVRSTGDIYRLVIDLDQNFDARFTYKVYTMEEGGAEFQEFRSYLHAVDNTYRPAITLQGLSSGWVALFIEADFSQIYLNQQISGGGEVLEWINRGLDYYLLDLTSLENFNNLTIARSFYPHLISAGQDLEIRFHNGIVFRFDRQTLEAMLQTDENLYLSAQPATAELYRKNAENAVASLGKFDFAAKDAAGNPASIYELGVRYRNRAGTPLYLSRGMTVLLPMDVGLQGPLLVSAELSPIREEFSRACLESTEMCSYADGMLTLTLKDFSKMSILVGESAESVSVGTPPDKTTYRVGDELDLAGLTVEVRYPNAAARTFAVTEDMISGFDTSRPGTCTVTVRFGEGTATFDITVEGDAPPEDGGCGSCKGASAGLFLPGILLAAALLKFRR